MAQDDKASSTGKGKEKEEPTNGVKEAEKTKDGKPVKAGAETDLPAGWQMHSRLTTLTALTGGHSCRGSERRRPEAQG